MLARAAARYSAALGRYNRALQRRPLRTKVATGGPLDVQLFVALARVAESLAGDFNMLSVSNITWAFANVGL